MLGPSGPFGVRQPLGLNIYGSSQPLPKVQSGLTPDRVHFTTAGGIGTRVQLGVRLPAQRPGLKQNRRSRTLRISCPSLLLCLFPV